MIEVSICSGSLKISDCEVVSLNDGFLFLLAARKIRGIDREMATRVRSKVLVLFILVDVERA